MLCMACDDHPPDNSPGVSLLHGLVGLDGWDQELGKHGVRPYTRTRLKVYACRGGLRAHTHKQGGAFKHRFPAGEERVEKRKVDSVLGQRKAAKKGQQHGPGAVGCKDVEEEEMVMLEEEDDGVIKQEGDGGMGNEEKAYGRSEEVGNQQQQQEQQQQEQKLPPHLHQQVPLHLPQNQQMPPHTQQTPQQQPSLPHYQQQHQQSPHPHHQQRQQQSLPPKQHKFVFSSHLRMAAHPTPIGFRTGIGPPLTLPVRPGTAWIASDAGEGERDVPRVREALATAIHSIAPDAITFEEAQLLIPASLSLLHHFVPNSDLGRAVFSRKMEVTASSYAEGMQVVASAFAAEHDKLSALVVKLCSDARALDSAQLDR